MKLGFNVYEKYEKKVEIKNPSRDLRADIIQVIFWEQGNHNLIKWAIVQ